MQKGGKTLITQFHLGILMKIKSNQYENCIQRRSHAELTLCNCYKVKHPNRKNIRKEELKQHTKKTFVVKLFDSYGIQES